jgi:hypothetical protein
VLLQYVEQQVECMIEVIFFQSLLAAGTSTDWSDKSIVGESSEGPDEQE